MTNTAAALKLTRETMFVPGAGDRIDVPNFAIVITDGQSNVNPETTLPESVATRLAAIQIIVVSVGEWFNSNLIILMFRHTTIWTMCSVDGVILPCGVCRYAPVFGHKIKTMSLTNILRHSSLDQNVFNT